MKNIPVNAKVECTDGQGGESTYLIIDPTSRKLTHVVIETKFPDPVERLVPVKYVVETSSDTINLSCTKEELAQMEPFTETHFGASSKKTLAVDGVLNAGPVRRTRSPALTTEIRFCSMSSGST